jgi:hypothetical protein
VFNEALLSKQLWQFVLESGSYIAYVVGNVVGRLLPFLLHLDGVGCFCEEYRLCLVMSLKTFFFFCF